jgi:hypothetical protein
MRQITSVLAMLVFAIPARAGIIGADGYTSTIDNSYYEVSVLLGNEITFDAWWEIGNPVAPGEPWPTLNLNVSIGGLPFLTSTSRNSSSTNWEPTVLDISGSSYVGTEQIVRFDVNDFNKDTGTTVFIKDVVSAVPGPAALVLIGIGLAGIGFARRKKA